MDAYTGFAEVYDTFMDNVPYDDWASYLHQLLCSYGVEDGLVLDLGCGTGSLTERLASYGYDMIGADFSEEMLDIAIDKRAESGHDILYLCQDMREFELYGTVRGIISACDSVNYITEPEELEQVFKLVNNYLDPSGLFIFDFNTEYKYRELLGENTFAEARDDCSFIWENYYDAEEMINEYMLTLFVEAEDGLYQRYEENHFQRAYTLDEMKQLIEAAGMIFVDAFDAYTEDAPRDDSERILVIAKEQGK